jgi:hypothetical protein
MVSRFSFRDFVFVLAVIFLVRSVVVIVVGPYKETDRFHAATIKPDIEQTGIVAEVLAPLSNGIYSVLVETEFAEADSRIYALLPKNDAVVGTCVRVNTFIMDASPLIPHRLFRAAEVIDRVTYSREQLAGR